MKVTRILLGIVGVAVVALVLSPASLAQCGAPKQFASYGVASLVWLGIDSGNFVDTFDYKRFWHEGSPSNISTASGGTCAQVVCCDASDWWDINAMLPAGTGSVRGVRAFISDGTCDMPACEPDPSVLVFDIEAPSADGSDAGFISYQIDQIAADARQWDLARTNPGQGSGTANAALDVMEAFPTVDVQSSSGAPPNTTITSDYADVAISYHGVKDGTANTQRAASDGIDSLDIVMFQGGADPGRDRSLWTNVKKIAYGDSSVSGDVIDVACGGGSDEVYLATGVTFVDGIESFLVGKSTAVECDPNIAEPDDSPRLKRFKKSLGRSGRR